MGFGVEEGALVFDNCGDVDGGQQAHLVERPIFLLLVEAVQRDGLECEEGIFALLPH